MRSTGPTVELPLKRATRTVTAPTRVASQPMTKSAGAERPSMVKIEAPIKETGLYAVKLNLGYEIETEVKVAVIKSQEKK